MVIFPSTRLATATNAKLWAIGGDGPRLMPPTGPWPALAACVAAVSATLRGKRLEEISVDRRDDISLVREI